jgi:hypothetical protein
MTDKTNTDRIERYFTGLLLHSLECELTDDNRRDLAHGRLMVQLGEAPALFADMDLRVVDITLRPQQGTWSITVAPRGDVAVHVRYCSVARVLYARYGNDDDELVGVAAAVDMITAPANGSIDVKPSVNVDAEIEVLKRAQRAMEACSRAVADAVARSPRCLTPAEARAHTRENWSTTMKILSER